MIGLVARPYPMTLVPNGSQYDAAFPPSNLSNNDFGRVVRITNPGASTGVRYVFDTYGNNEVDVLGLFWHNLSQAGDVVRFIGTNNSDGVTAPLYDSGYVSGVTGTTSRDILSYWKTLLTMNASVFARYWSVELSVQAGRTIYACRLFVGKKATFQIGAGKAIVGAKDMNASTQTEVGDTRQQEDPSLIRPVVSLSFNYAKQSEMEKLVGQYTLGLGISKPMLICTDLTAANIQDNTAFGRPDKVVAMESDTYDIWTFEAVVPSIGP